MSPAPDSQLDVRPTKGRGKMVMGFLIYNIGLTLLLDSTLFNASLAVFALGFGLFLYGHAENFWVARVQNSEGMKTTSKQAIGAALVTLAFMVEPVIAAPQVVNPTAQIQQVDQLLKQFHKGKTLTPAQDKENQAIKNRVLKEDFDLYEMCRLALDDHWGKIPQAKRQEFVGLFTTLLLRNAILHSEKHTGQEKIDYLGEEGVDGFKGRKRVKTKIEVPEEAVDFDVNYEMVFDPKKNRWRIYDLILDEESLMLNYRDQFDRIIAKEGFNGLLGRLKKKAGSKSL